MGGQYGARNSQDDPALNRKRSIQYQSNQEDKGVGQRYASPIMNRNGMSIIQDPKYMNEGDRFKRQ